MKFIVCWILSLLVVAALAAEKSELLFENHSADFLSIHWVDPRDGYTVPIKSDIRPATRFSLNSYQGHAFEVRQEVNPATGLCGSGDEECDKIGHFEVTKFPKQEFIIKEGAQIEEVLKSLASSKSLKAQELMEEIDFDDVVDPIDVLSECKIMATNNLSELDKTQEDYQIQVEEINEDFKDCITVGLAPKIKAYEDEVEFERALRLESANIGENFTCVNTDLESSPDVDTEDWLSEKDGMTRTVHKKLERPASKIHVVSNFASDEECAAMEEEASSKLHAASTADGKGGAKVSAARKAMQAGIKPRFGEDGAPLDGNPIATLSQRVYEYTNHVLDMNLTHHGQEPLMSIQYFGRGRHDIEPDRYTPHCDGKCTGEPHPSGGRMATMVIYCTLPTQGGFTNFQNANVHVRPQAGDAVFFSYFDPLTNLTDHGLTQHSGCPVYEGEKKIITQWVRYGVSADRPHSAFNTLGKLIAEDGE